jgi:hypothetical protein
MLDHDDGATESNVLDCGDRERVRLLFYERSSGHPMVAAYRTASPPKIARESLVCIERAVK